MLDVTDVTKERAPDFVPGYPSKGERIGPAWDWLWWRFGDGSWRSKSDVLSWLADGEIPGDLVPKTIDGMLMSAVRAKLLERRLVRRKVPTKAGTPAARTIAQYRRKAAS